LRGSKFSAPIIDGKSVAVEGLQKRYEFKMEQESRQLARN